MLPPRAWLRGEGEDAVSSGSAHIVVSSLNIERVKVLGVESPGRARSLDEQGKENCERGLNPSDHFKPRGKIRSGLRSQRSIHL